MVTDDAEPTTRAQRLGLRPENPRIPYNRRLGAGPARLGESTFCENPAVGDDADQQT